MKFTVGVTTKDNRRYDEVVDTTSPVSAITSHSKLGPHFFDSVTPKTEKTLITYAKEQGYIVEVTELKEVKEEVKK